jgi:hypothetical protein
MAARGEYTVRVQGLRECLRALHTIDRDTKKVVLAGLRAAAVPVAGDANRRLDRYQGIGPITTRASQSGVFIQQSRRKVTGKRADFGALQMRKGLIPAAEGGGEEFVSRVDEALGLLIHAEGF